MRITNAPSASAHTGDPSHLALPPPTLALDLTEIARRIGWVRDDAVGFRGFGSRDEAAHAAWAAVRAVARRLDRRGANGRPVATLLRPRARGTSDSESFGFEIRLPAPTDELTMRAAAHVVYRTLGESGLPWALPSRAARRGPPKHAAEAAERVRGAARAAPPPTPMRRGESSLGATLLRAATVALIVVLVAIAARPFATTQPITIPVAVVAVAGLCAAAIGEANRRWQPRRWEAAHSARTDERRRFEPSPRRAH